MQFPQGQPVLPVSSHSAYAPRLKTYACPLPCCQLTPPQGLHHRTKNCYRCSSSSHLQARCPEPPRRSVSQQL
ncbi:hypothetical protein XENTR_v10005275 [Xenopus tropicalis]|nr:hypothetical protein XENTR_v10005275 [Xenopus tropicalis]